MPARAPAAAEIRWSGEDVRGRVAVAFGGNRDLGDEGRELPGGRGHDPAGALLGLHAIGVRDLARANAACPGPRSIREPGRWMLTRPLST